jgi:hypothetical protein
MFDILIAESTTILAHSEPNPMATGTVIGARVFGIEGLHRGTTFYADGHLKCS